MPHAHSNTVDSDISGFSSLPPPPYSGPDEANPTVLPQAFARPRLPEAKRNMQLSDRESILSEAHNKSMPISSVPEESYAVKFQTIVREAKEIVVGRIKVPTVSLSRVHHNLSI